MTRGRGSCSSSMAGGGCNNDINPHCNWCSSCVSCCGQEPSETLQLWALTNRSRHQGPFASNTTNMAASRTHPHGALKSSLKPKQEHLACKDVSQPKRWPSLNTELQKYNDSKYFILLNTHPSCMERGTPQSDTRKTQMDQSDCNKRTDHRKA